MRIFIVLAIVFLGIASIAYAYNDGDTQVWNTDVEEFQLKKDLKFVFEQEFRWGSNASEFYYQHYDAGLIYALNKSWALGGGYRQVIQRSNASKPWVTDNEPYAFITYFGELAGFKFDDRNRFELQYYSRNKSNGRYRNKLSVKAPWKFTKLEIQPYLSDEIFMAIGNGQGFNQNRLSGGFGFTLTKNIKAELYYMLLTLKSGEIWKDHNVWGSKVKLAF
ncbi:MAG: DUF2490 domain-containing protein [Candidatus Omnitrophota bacterium]